MSLLLFFCFEWLRNVQIFTMHRVCMGPGKPGKSWHFPGLESPEKKLLVLETCGNLLKSGKKT